MRNSVLGDSIGNVLLPLSLWVRFWINVKEPFLHGKMCRDEGSLLRSPAVVNNLRAVDWKLNSERHIVDRRTAIIWWRDTARLTEVDSFFLAGGRAVERKVITGHSPPITATFILGCPDSPEVQLFGSGGPSCSVMDSCFGYEAVDASRLQWSVTTLPSAAKTCQFFSEILSKSTISFLSLWREGRVEPTYPLPWEIERRLRGSSTTSSGLLAAMYSSS